MKRHGWDAAIAAKLTIGAILSLVAGLLADVLPRKWPTGGAR